MFRKHTALAAAIMIAATASISIAESALDRPAIQQGCCTTSDAYFIFGQGCNSTYGDLCATCSTANSTSASCCTTFGACNPTSGMICRESSPCSSTGMPQQPQAPGATQQPSTGEDYTTQSVSAQEQKMLNLLNQDRKNNGLATLAIDPELCRIARVKSADMRDNHYFAHESPTYGDVRAMLRRFGYAFSGAGENIAHHANVDKAQAAFMSSSGHRANILSTAWTKVGIGIVTDASGYIYATQIFAR